MPLSEQSWGSSDKNLELKTNKTWKENKNNIDKNNLDDNFYKLTKMTFKTIRLYLRYLLHWNNDEKFKKMSKDFSKEFN